MYANCRYKKSKLLIKQNRKGQIWPKHKHPRPCISHLVCVKSVYCISNLFKNRPHHSWTTVNSVYIHDYIQLHFYIIHVVFVCAQCCTIYSEIIPFPVSLSHVFFLFFSHYDGDLLCEQSSLCGYQEFLYTCSALVMFSFTAAASLVVPP